jgi:hypothetical protein
MEFYLSTCRKFVMIFSFCVSFIQILWVDLGWLFWRYLRWVSKFFTWDSQNFHPGRLDLNQKQLILAINCILVHNSSKKANFRLYIFFLWDNFRGISPYWKYIQLSLLIKNFQKTFNLLFRKFWPIVSKKC